MGLLVQATVTFRNPAPVQLMFFLTKTLMIYVENMIGFTWQRTVFSSSLFNKSLFLVPNLLNKRLRKITYGEKKNKNKNKKIYIYSVYGLHMFLAYPLAELGELYKHDQY